MSAQPADLPDDVDALKAMVVAQLREQLSSRAIEIEHLKLTIAKLRRMQFGRKSEKLDHQIEQLELRLEDLLADEGVADMAAITSTPRPRREGAARKPLPDHLEREGACSFARRRQLPGLRWPTQVVRRRRCGMFARTSVYPSSSAEGRLPMLRPHHAGRSTESSGRSRHPRSGVARAHRGIGVRLSHSTAVSGSHVRARR
jgi:hypothetical protein